MAQLDNVYIRKGADSSFIDWPEKSQNLILIICLQSSFFHYQIRASLGLNIKVHIMYIPAEAFTTLPESTLFSFLFHFKL